MIILTAIGGCISPCCGDCIHFQQTVSFRCNYSILRPSEVTTKVTRASQMSLNCQDRSIALTYARVSSPRNMFPNVELMFGQRPKMLVQH